MICKTDSPNVLNRFKTMKDVLFIDNRKIGGILSYSFVISRRIARRIKTYYLYITFLHIKHKDNFYIFTFNDFNKAKAFIDDWFNKKLICKKQEVMEAIKVMQRHDFKKTRVNSIIHRQSLGGSVAREVVKPFRQTNVLSAIPKGKLKLKDIADLPKEDIVDFLKMHFLRH